MNSVPIELKVKELEEQINVQEHTIEQKTPTLITSQKKKPN